MGVSTFHSASCTFHQSSLFRASSSSGDSGGNSMNFSSVVDQDFSILIGRVARMKFKLSGGTSSMIWAARENSHCSAHLQVGVHFGRIVGLTDVHLRRQRAIFTRPIVQDEVKMARSLLLLRAVLPRSNGQYLSIAVLVGLKLSAQIVCAERVITSSACLPPIKFRIFHNLAFRTSYTNLQQIRLEFYRGSHSLSGRIRKIADRSTP